MAWPVRRLCSRGSFTESPAMHPDPTVTISVVSHGHDELLRPLLDQIARTSAGHVRRVVLTHNLPVRQGILGRWPFELVQIHNDRPKGFGANHNQALAHVHTAWMVVLNPDMVLDDPQLWPSMLEAASRDGVGAVAPTLLNQDGSRQDQARALVTPWSLFLRRVLGRRERRVDWYSAAFLMFPTALFADLGGFDERYHMYCEDVDLCLRLQLGGHALVRAEGRATHLAQRDSLRQWRPAVWHVQSLWRLWRSPVFWDYLRWRAQRQAAPG